MGIYEYIDWAKIQQHMRFELVLRKMGLMRKSGPFPCDYPMDITLADIRWGWQYRPVHEEVPFDGGLPRMSAVQRVINYLSSPVRGVVLVNSSGARYVGRQDTGVVTLCLADGSIITFK